MARNAGGLDQQIAREVQATSRMKPKPITTRDIDTLRELEAACRNYVNVTGEDWVKPLDLGSWNGSHHSATLRKLAGRGLVEASRKPMRNGCRPGIRYRITGAGRDAIAQARLKQS